MICPVCGEESFPRKKTVMEGWKVTGSREVCALCGAEWPGMQEEKQSGCGSDKSARLSALLGGEKTETVTLAGSADQDFCRNCVHFLVHPFKNLCGLTDEETDPNGTCPRFRKRPL